MIYVNAPIQIIDTDNKSKNIVMQYGLYSYNWFLKYLIISYDQITFNKANSTSAILQIVSNPKPLIDVVNGTDSNTVNIGTITAPMMNWLISGFDNYFKFSSNVRLVDSFTNYNIICKTDSSKNDNYYFINFQNFY